MKTVVLTLVIFLFSAIITQISAFARTTPPTPLSNTLNQCEENHHKGNLTCIKNDDNTFNVTFDCHLNGHKRVELILQYPNFPKKMKYLTIQNCESLVLDLHCEILSKLPHEEVSSSIHVSHLHIFNISNVMVRKEKENHSDFHFFPPRLQKTLISLDLGEIESWEDFDESEENEHEEREFYYLNDLVADTLTGVTFENIRHAYFEDAHIPSGLFRCDKSEKDKLEYFKMINIKALHFKGFSNDFPALKEFIMDNVTVLPRDIYTPLEVNNTEAVVKIINSNLFKLNRFFKGAASKLIVTGNKIQQVPMSAFSFQTDEFIFSENIVERMDLLSLEGQSLSTHVTNNIIHIVGERAFSGIGPRKDNPTLNHINNKRIYNFSNNEMHILHDDAITIPFITPLSYYDSIVVFNNSINCSCQNFMWFGHMAESRYNTRLTYNFLMKKVNQNKCLNIPNCTLAQALYNFQELCESNYRCPMNVTLTNSSSNFIREIEETLGSTLQVNREISDTNLKILQVLKSDFDSHSHNNDNGSLMTVNTLCLIILLLLSCTILGYFILVRTGRLRDFRSKRLRSLDDTEMNSCVSLTS